MSASHMIRQQMSSPGSWCPGPMHSVTMMILAISSICCGEYPNCGRYFLARSTPNGSFLSYWSRTCVVEERSGFDEERPFRRQALFLGQLDAARQHVLERVVNRMVRQGRRQRQQLAVHEAIGALKVRGRTRHGRRRRRSTPPPPKYARLTVGTFRIADRPSPIVPGKANVCTVPCVVVPLHPD